MVSSHQAIPCDTSSVSYSLTQLGHCLPADSVRSHGLGAQSHKTAPTLLKIQLQVVGHQITHNSVWFGYKLRGSHLPLLKLD